MKSSRSDGRGHWPRGRRRNADVTVDGWRSASAFLRALGKWLKRHRKVTELAAHLACDRHQLYRWLGTEKIPTQERIDAMAAWFRSHR